MKRLLLLVLLVLAPPAAASDLLPPFAFADADGRRLTLADYAGQVVLLDFWASWCAPCIKEMPTLERLQRNYGERGLAVLPVSIDRGGVPKVRLFYRQHGITGLPVLTDQDREAATALGIDTIPVSYLIGRDGRLIARFSGPHDWEAEAALIERALAE